MLSFLKRCEGEPFDEVALLLACDFDPAGHAESARAELDRLSAQVRARPDDSPHEQALALAAVLGRFRGDRSRYYSITNSWLTHVLRSGRGIPLTLAALWMGVGRRAGLQVEGILFPGHYLVRVGGYDGVLVDVFDGGEILDEVGLRELAARFPDFPGDPVDQLRVATTIQSTRRMLLNIRRASMKAGDESRALLACDRMLEINPSPLLHRHRGIHAMRLGAWRAAAADFRIYLKERPHSPNTAEVEEALRVCESKEGGLN